MLGRVDRAFSSCQREFVNCAGIGAIGRNLEYEESARRIVAHKCTEWQRRRRDNDIAAVTAVILFSQFLQTQLPVEHRVSSRREVGRPMIFAI